MRRRLSGSLKTTALAHSNELLKRDQQIALFKEVVAVVRDRLDLDEIFHMAATFTQSLIGAETVLIPVLDMDCTHYTYRAGCGLNADEIVNESLDINLGICGWVWKHKRPWWRGVLDELSEKERNQWEREVGNIILVPMIGRNHFLGGIACINKTGGRDFDEHDLDLLTLLANQVAIAIDNSSLILQLEQSNQALIQEKEKVQVTLSSIGDAVITTDIHGHIEYLNPVAERLFDMPLNMVKSKILADTITLLFEEDRQPALGLVHQSLIEGQLPIQFASLILQRQDNSEVHIHPTAAPIRDHAGKTSGVVLVFRDVSQTYKLNQQLSYQATHDALTGLYNRSEFEYQLKQEIRNSKTSRIEHSLLHMDLDQFKVVNDTCGHIAGDELLKQYSAKLLEMVRHGDTLARIGGDEFGLLLNSCPLSQATRIANKIQEMTQAFHFMWEDKSFSVGISIGLIGINADSVSSISVMSLVDAACCMAKESGHSHIYIHNEDDQALHQRRDQMQWSPRITRALEEQRMLLYHQPIVHRDGLKDMCSHYEILIRMIDEAGALVPPGFFLPAAERYNLIANIDRWVVNTYFRWLAEHPLHLKSLELGSLNLSGRSLGDEDCLRYIENQLREFSLPPEKICFEITETEAIANLSKATRFIKQLQNLGCRFALDDFGSGFSSYAYLKHLPVDFLKIDGMFIKDIATDPINYAMVESINHIGHVTGRKTIAEFVEDQITMKILQDLGIDYMQGYGIAKPSSIKNLTNRDVP